MMFYKISRLITAIIFLITFLYLIVRSIKIGHLPIFGTYESDLAQITVTLLLNLIVSLNFTNKSAFHIVSLICILEFIHAFSFDAASMLLTISERGLLAHIHGIFGWLTWAFLWVGSINILTDSKEKGFFLLRLGYIFLCALIATGAFYSSILFGSWWTYDPVMIASLISFLLFSIFFHLITIHGFTIKRAKGFLVFSMIIFVFAMKMMPYLPEGQTFHVFEIQNLAKEAD